MSEPTNDHIDSVVIRSIANSDSTTIAKDTDCASQISSAQECANMARKLWLSSSNTSSVMALVESLYCKALGLNIESNRKRKMEDETRCSSHNHFVVPLSDVEYAQTAEKYCLLLCQSGRSTAASSLLSSLGFTCRLSSTVLDYPTMNNCTLENDNETVSSISKLRSGSSGKDPCLILDNFVDSTTLTHLSTIFSDINASYWTYHDYNIEPPSPYFSYVIPIQSFDTILLQQYGFLGNLISTIYQSPILRSHFPGLEEATKVEMWAHNRPHASGHQLHFDSDNEGRGGNIRNPILSTVLYLTEDQGCGGPSVVTNQTLRDRRLASKAWLCYPKYARLVAFDGTVLHGVVPGSATTQPHRPGVRRVTLMFAFWKDIRIRKEESHGAARPFPDHTELISWVQELLRPIPVSPSYEEVKQTDPYCLDHMYETLDGLPWSKEMGFPPYDRVFQGF